MSFPIRFQKRLSTLPLPARFFLSSLYLACSSGDALLPGAYDFYEFALLIPYRIASIETAVIPYIKSKKNLDCEYTYLAFF